MPLLSSSHESFRRQNYASYSTLNEVFITKTPRRKLRHLLRFRNYFLILFPLSVWMAALNCAAISLHENAQNCLQMHFSRPFQAIQLQSLLLNGELMMSSKEAASQNLHEKTPKGIQMRFCVLRAQRVQSTQNGIVLLDAITITRAATIEVIQCSKKQ